jgi:uroporphyrinogen-III synthase
MRVLITRARKDAEEFTQGLQAMGAEATFLPTIEITPVSDTTALDKAISQLHDYDWLILTSANAAEVFLKRKNALGIKHMPVQLKLAAIGPKTAARLQDHLISPDFIPEEYVAEAILSGLGDLKGRWVLLPTADIAHDTLPQAIQAEGGIAHVITAYHTMPAKPDSEGLSALRSGVDVITFTSGSTVHNFHAMVSNAGLDPLRLPGDPKIACIGPKTAATAKEMGFRVDIVANEYTIEGLIQAIQNHMPGKQGL